MEGLFQLFGERSRDFQEMGNCLLFDLLWLAFPLERGEGKSWLKTQHSENYSHGIWSHHFMAKRWETMDTVTAFILGGSKTTADGDCSHEIKRRLFLRRKAMTNLDSIVIKQRHYFANKVPSSQSYGFPSSHVQM